MNEEYLEEFSSLLNKLWVTKDDSDFYKIKSKITDIREIANKMGCDVIANNKLIKMEKVPIWLDDVYKIDEFDDELDYVLYIILIMFLEDKGLDEQFVLSNLTEYIDNILAGINGDIKPDWTKYKDRKTLVDVLKYATSIGIIRLRDKSLDFSDDIRAEALYENTTLSHYVVRNFKFDVFKCSEAQDFIDKELMTFDNLEYKRIIAYRALFLYPLVPLLDLRNDAFLYLRNMRNNISKDVEKYLKGELIFVKDMAVVSTDECDDIFPNLNKSITDIILLVCHYVRNYIEENNTNVISKTNFNNILQNVYEDNYKYFSKKYRELSSLKFCIEISNYMESFKMLKIMEDNVLIYPITYMYEGMFEKFSEKEEENIEMLSFWEE